MRHAATAIAGALALSAALVVPAQAQTRVDGDPHAQDPVGIVEEPCPHHPMPSDGEGWQVWNLHMLTRDFGQLCRYAEANKALKAKKTPVEVVFMGDSITDNWQNIDPDFWTNGRVDRGISGQTTQQMLVRYREDVLKLKPRAVHILAATNDIAGNTGAATMEQVTGNIETMAELARAHGIKVILGSVPPAKAFPWAPDKHPDPQVRALNVWLKGYAAREGFTYVDYWSALGTPEGAMGEGLSSDGVHPTAEGYAIMAPLAKAAIAHTLGDVD